MRVLIDTNVVIDVLQQREPWFEAGSAVFLAAADNIITGCLTAKQLADIHFFSRKQFKGLENVDASARAVVEKLMSLFEIIDTQTEDCRAALAIDNGDYEDAMLIASARRAKADCIVTRNIEHFKPAHIPVYTPEELLTQLVPVNN